MPARRADAFAARPELVLGVDVVNGSRFNLSPKGELLTLIDRSGAVDAVEYDDKDGWPEAADGGAPASSSIRLDRPIPSPSRPAPSGYARETQRREVSDRRDTRGRRRSGIGFESRGDASRRFETKSENAKASEQSLARRPSPAALR